MCPDNWAESEKTWHFLAHLVHSRVFSAGRSRKCIYENTPCKKIYIEIYLCVIILTCVHIFAHVENADINQCMSVNNGCKKKRMSLKMRAFVKQTIWENSPLKVPEGSSYIVKKLAFVFARYHFLLDEFAAENSRSVPETKPHY